MKNLMNNNINLNPQWVTGFIDAEGCFHISVVDKSRAKLKKGVRAIFQITLHIKDIAILYRIQEFFKVGIIAERKDNACSYTITSLKDLIILTKYLEKYPLLTEKWVDYVLFKQVIELMLNNEHLTNEGLQKIINIKAAMNFEKLSDKLWNSFPNTVPVSRPERNKPMIINPEWLSGFVDGEGCFTINLYNRKDTILGKGIKLVFKITQDNRNIDILENVTKLLGCGKLYSQSKVTKSNVTDYMVTGLSEITTNIIPFFKEFPLQSIKTKEFANFIEISELMKNKAHLTKEGLEKIQKIKENMNKR